MDEGKLAEWLLPLPVPDRVRALTRIYSSLTVCSRELFLPDRFRGKETVVIEMLHGVNELHHTTANWLTAYTTDESKSLPVDGLARQLLQIATHYRISGFLASAIGFAQTGARAD